VILSDGLWKRRFGSDPQIIGRAITLCCAPRQYTVIGVMAPDSRAFRRGGTVGAVRHVGAAGTMAERGTRGFAALARLKPGVTLAAAQRDMDAISRRLEQAYPNTNDKRGAK